ncbi:MAG TPA: L-threonylcarbamoyladenylate synthase [Xanthobacteraceae bacterium]|jgi:L-threonylcarbamoyladenylate synthase|nr:L-threonylcarbamoyladenylate synthase [Xanthobacteraceae bacterium]
MNTELATRVMKADAQTIEAAARGLAEGGLVAFPTETVYGLGADATNAAAVARLYQAKGRPAFNPLIAHVADIQAARRLARFDTLAEHLAAALWPGPLTLVLPKSPDCPVCDLATAGLDSIGVRLPDHRVAHDILAALGRPIVAPSANRSGHVSPTTAAHVVSDLSGRIDLIVDGGPTAVGVESTIIACLDGNPTLLRPGGYSRAKIEQIIGRALADPVLPLGAPSEGEIVIAPGMLASHYAPKARMRLGADRVDPGEALLAFGSAHPAGADQAVMTLNLSAAGDLVEAAAALFSHLRTLDASGAASIAVMPVPSQGLGEAINDRLARAAAPRPSP